MRVIKEKKIIDPNAKIDLFSLLFLSCFYIGYIPKASGTFGSLFGLLFFLIKGFERIEILLAVSFLCFIIGTFTSKSIIKKYGDDPSIIVIDEVVGMWVTILAFKILSGTDLSLFYILISFSVFRFFDIIKVQPSKYFDKIQTGFGVMMDDVIAGFYAGIIVYLISLTKYNPPIL